MCYASGFRDRWLFNRRPVRVDDGAWGLEDSRRARPASHELGADHHADLGADRMCPERAFNRPPPLAQLPKLLERLRALEVLRNVERSITHETWLGQLIHDVRSL